MNRSRTFALDALCLAVMALVVVWVGDLILTATGALSRNRMLGMKVAAGLSPAEYVASQRTVAEGYGTSRAAYRHVEWSARTQNSSSTRPMTSVKVPIRCGTRKNCQELPPMGKSKKTAAALPQQ